MLKGPDAQTDKFLTDLARISRRIEKAQYEITSGRRINKVSDAPNDVPRLLEMRSELSATEQIRTNLSRVEGEVNAAEGAVRHAVDLVERALSLGTQGATDFATPEQRQTLSNEIAAILEQLVATANTANEGRYLFSGDADLFAPYSIDTSLDDPFSLFNGAISTRKVMHPAGTLFAVAKTAEDIFDNADPAKNVFETLNSLRLALRDDDSAGITTAIASVRSANVHLNNMLAFYGTVQNQVAEAVDFSHKQELRLQQQISSIQDADLTTAILDLERSRFQQEASLSAQGRLSKISLFNYLG
jgi:flagellar hook-associated protein 3 FlgL